MWVPVDHQGEVVRKFMSIERMLNGESREPSSTTPGGLLRGIGTNEPAIL
jgi:hypothetical protein